MLTEKLLAKFRIAWLPGTEVVSESNLAGRRFRRLTLLFRICFHQLSRCPQNFASTLLWLLSNYWISFRSVKCIWQNLWSKEISWGIDAPLLPAHTVSPPSSLHFAFFHNFIASSSFLLELCKHVFVVTAQLLVKLQTNWLAVKRVVSKCNSVGSRCCP